MAAPTVYHQGWKLDDVSWDAFKPGLVDSTLLAAIKAAAQTIAVSETGYSGTFTQTATCTSIATVTPASAAGPQASFTVTPSAGGS